MVCPRCKTVAEDLAPVQARSQDMTLHVEATPAPIVNVQPPQVTVEAAQAPVVQVLPDAAYAKGLQELKDIMLAPVDKQLLRDENGRLSGVRETKVVA
jgi:hypothetical protein